VSGENYGPLSEKCIQMHKIKTEISTEVKTFLEFRGHKLLCCLHSLLNEKLNSSEKLVKIKLYPPPLNEIHAPPKIYQVKNGCTRMTKSMRES